MLFRLKYYQHLFPFISDMDEDSEQVECPTCNLQFRNSQELGIHSTKLCYPPGSEDYEALLLDTSLDISNNKNHLKSNQRVSEFVEPPRKSFHNTIKSASKGPTHTDDPIESKSTIKSASNNAFIALPLMCSICKAVFETSSSLQLHLREHTRDPCKDCDVCGKSFNNFGDWKRHRGVHAAVKDYLCDVCGKGFAYTSSFNEHVKIHRVKEKKYICKVCGKAFISYNRLNTHSHQHYDKRQFICKECGKECIGNLAFLSHRRWHRKQVKCPVCSKSFASPSYLKIHMYSHSAVADDKGQKRRIRNK